MTATLARRTETVVAQETGLNCYRIDLGAREAQLPIFYLINLLVSLILVLSKEG
jgi:hypothetical protein